MSPAKRTYKALVGLTYDDDKKRVEAGQTVTDLPAGAVKWLLEAGAIAEVKERGRGEGSR